MNFVCYIMQVVCGGCTEWDTIWSFCSSPEWIAHQIISEERGYTNTKKLVPSLNSLRRGTF